MFQLHCGIAIYNLKCPHTPEAINKLRSKLKIEKETGILDDSEIKSIIFYNLTDQDSYIINTNGDLEKV